MKLLTDDSVCVVYSLTGGKEHHIQSSENAMQSLHNVVIPAHPSWFWPAGQNGATQQLEKKKESIYVEFITIMMVLWIWKCPMLPYTLAS